MQFINTILNKDSTLLEKFSSVTTAISEALQPISDTLWKDGAKPELDIFAQEFISKWSQVESRRSRRMGLRQPYSHDSLSDDLSGIMEDEYILEEIESAVGTFQFLQDSFPSHPLDPPIAIKIEEILSWMDESGKFIHTDVFITDRIMKSGVEAKARPLMFLFIMGIFPWKSTTNERKVISTNLLHGYKNLESRWKSLTNESTKLSQVLMERKWKIEKDVVRTDRSTSFYSFKLDSCKDCILKGDKTPNYMDNTTTECTENIKTECIENTKTECIENTKTDSKDGSDKTRPKTKQDIEQTDIDHGSSSYIHRQLELFRRLLELRDILMCYVVFKIDTGYAQGMSDLLSPLYAITYNSIQVASESSLDQFGLSRNSEQALSFWMFVRFMSWNGKFLDASKIEFERTSQKTFVHSAVSPFNQSLLLEANNIIMNFNMNQVGMRTRLLLLIYLLRLIDPELWRLLEEMEEANTTDFSAVGPTSLIWVFRSLLVLFKREVMPSTDPENYESISRLWEAILAGRLIWSEWTDVWFAAAIIVVYVKPRLTASHEPLDTFEGLLKYMNSQLVHDLNIEEIIGKVPKMMKKLARILKLEGVPEVFSNILYESLKEHGLNDDHMIEIKQWEVGYWFPQQKYDSKIEEWAIKEGKGRFSVSDVDISLADAIWCLTKSS